MAKKQTLEQKLLNVMVLEHFSNKYIRVACAKGRSRRVRAHVLEVLAVHRDLRPPGQDYIITHVPTGYGIPTRFEDRYDALHAAFDIITEAEDQGLDLFFKVGEFDSPAARNLISVVSSVLMPPVSTAVQ